MYDAITRNTYAELIKTAEAKMPERLSSVLVKVAARLPAVRDALLRVAKEKR
jgi:hypothetical protein